jgi:hypothetical protein
MHTAVCPKQDVAQQSNVYPSTANLLLSHSRVTRQISARHNSYRHELKTGIRLHSSIVTTSMRNHFVSASKAANELYPTSGVRISDQSVKT